MEPEQDAAVSVSTQFNIPFAPTQSELATMDDLETIDDECEETQTHAVEGAEEGDTGENVAKETARTNAKPVNMVCVECDGGLGETGKLFPFAFKKELSYLLCVHHRKKYATKLPWFNDTILSQAKVNAAIIANRLMATQCTPPFFCGKHVADDKFDPVDALGVDRQVVESVDAVVDIGEFTGLLKQNRPRSADTPSQPKRKRQRDGSLQRAPLLPAPLLHAASPLFPAPLLLDDNLAARACKRRRANPAVAHAHSDAVVTPAEKFEMFLQFLDYLNKK